MKLNVNESLLKTIGLTAFDFDKRSVQFVMLCTVHRFTWKDSNKLDVTCSDLAANQHTCGFRPYLSIYLF